MLRSLSVKLKLVCLFVLLMGFSISHAQTLYTPGMREGSGYAMGNQTCPYDYRTADDYNEDGMSKAEVKASAKISTLKEKKRKILAGQRALKKELKEIVSPEYAEAIIDYAENRECGNYDSYITKNTSGVVTSKSESLLTFTAADWGTFCTVKGQPVVEDTVKGTISVSVLCKQKGLYKKQKSESGCNSFFADYEDLNENIRDIDEAIAQAKEDQREARRESFKKQLDQSETEGCSDCREAQENPNRIKPWQWAVGIGADILLNYGAGKQFSKNSEYYARLGYPPPNYSPYPGPVMTAGMMNAQLSGVGSGAWGCAGGIHGGGYPYGPGGMYGINGGISAGGGYGQGTGGYGYPIGVVGNGYPGSYGYPGGFAGVIVGGVAGGYAGGYPGVYAGGYPGAYAGGYPGGAGGAIVGTLAGGYPGAYPGVVAGGYPGAYPGAVAGAIAGGVAGGYPGMYAGGYPGVYAGGYPGAYPGAVAGAIAGGVAGGYPGMYAGGYPGVYAGGYPGAYPGAVAGAMAGGVAGGYAGGYPGVYAGGALAGGTLAGGLAGTAQLELQQQQMKLYFEYQQRIVEQQRTKQETSSRIYQQMMVLQRQLMELQMSGTGSFGVGGSVGGYLDIGVGGSTTVNPGGSVR